MGGIEIVVSADDIYNIILPRVARLAELDTGELLDAIGTEGVNQTQRRISSEKTDPDGAPWPTNLRGGSVLVLEGHLLGSITHEASGSAVAWGSNLVYAAVHQNGATIRAKDGGRLAFSIGNRKVFAKQVTIPRRAYLGLSAANQDDLAELLNDWIERTLQ